MERIDELILCTKKGIGFPVAGMILMLIASVLVWSLPMKFALIAVFAATGLTLPLGFLLSKFFKSDLMTKIQPFTSIGLSMNLVQLAYWPVILLLYYTNPIFVPFVMMVLFGSHFIPYGALYKSKGYYFLGISLPVTASILLLFDQEISYKYTFICAAPLYAIAVFMVLQENKNVLAEAQSNE